MSNRRQFIWLMAAISALVGIGPRQSEAEIAGIQFDKARTFTFHELKHRAKTMAMKAYSEPVIRHGDILEAIDYDAFQEIVSKRERGIGEDGRANFPVQPFQLGRHFKVPVKLHILDRDQAREILYRSDYFAFGETGLAKILPEDLGFPAFDFRIVQERVRIGWLFSGPHIFGPGESAINTAYQQGGWRLIPLCPHRRNFPFHGILVGARQSGQQPICNLCAN